MSALTTNDLEQLVPEQWRDRLCIAGGYAADPERAADIDLWVLAGGAEMGTAIDELRDWVESEHELEVASREIPATYASNGESALITCAPGYAKPVQLLVSDAQNVGELLDNFDITTHMVATKGSARFVRPATTDWFTTPKVLRFSTPQRTLARLLKIANRYGLAPRVEDIHKLSTLVADLGIHGPLWDTLEEQRA